MLGDIMYVKIHALRRRGIPNWGVFGQKHLQGGGPLIDLGVHMIESAHYAMGEPKALAACGKTWTFMGDKPGDVVCRWPGWDYKTYTVEDLAVGQVRFENGVLMQIESSFCNHIPEDGNYWEIFGTKGSFSTRDKVAATDLAGTMLNMKPGFLEENPWPTDFVSKLRNFGDAILEGTPLCVPGDEGLEIQKILDGLYRSADLNGAEVTIK
jgi:predicted dehydrogenase